LLAPAGAFGQEPPPRDVNVNTTSDAGTGGCNAVECTLREAIGVARPIDTVRVPAGVYVLTQGDLFLNAERIVGAGARSTIVDGNAQRRVFTVNSAGAAGSDTTVTGVTVRNGNGTSTSTAGGNGIGGGINVQSGNLALNSSHVVGNTAGGPGGGIALAGGGNLTMIATTVAGNTATGRSVEGGGIGVTGENAGIGLLNSTVSGNRAISIFGNPGMGGGIFAGSVPRLVLINATIAGNEAATGGGIVISSPANLQISGMNNTIVTGNSGGACGGPLANMTTHHNLVQDSTCALSGTGDVQGVNATLLGLTNNGGPTDTRALPAGSPAIDKGGSCSQTDQRGIARPAGACDIGAFEYVAPTLTVNVSVVNDSGGTAGSLPYRVTRNGADVAGSPASANSSFTLEPGTFNVSSALAGYTVTFGGDCSPAGDVTLGENQTKACTLVANDNAPVSSPLPPPVLRKTVNMTPARGTIRIKRPGQKRFRRLAAEGAQLPVGTTVDALKGRVRIVAASDGQGGTDTADFYGGMFRIGQTKGRKPTTVLALTEKLTCPRAGSAIAAARKKRRRLWGDGSGRFRTKGKHSAATVVGTKWLVEDRCTSTLTRVVRGRVSVRDFVKKKTVSVRKGKKYIARAKR
jgi:hypothetical protein